MSVFLSLFTKFRSSVLLKNYSALSFVQGLNYLLPLLVIPYVTRITGPEKYGIISFAHSVVMYFILIINYGFDYTATREISASRNDSDKVSRIFSTVLTTKLLLFIFSAVIFTVFSLLCPIDSELRLVFFLTFLMCAGQLFLSSWLYQGYEILTTLSVFMFIARFFPVVMMFFFIKKEADYIWYPLLISAGQIFAGVSTHIYALKKLRIQFKFTGIGPVIHELRKGFPVFFSTLIISLYTTLNTVLLGIFGNVYSVGIFAAAAKIIGISQNLLFMPFTQSFYPNTALEFSKSVKEGYERAIKGMKYFTPLMGAAGLIMFLFADFIISFLFGSEFSGASDILRITAFIPLIVSFSNIFGVQILLNLRQDKLFLFMTLSAALISLPANILVIPAYGAAGVASVWLLTELYVALFAFAAVRKVMKNHV